MAPDNVAFPLASAPRIYVARRWIEAEAQQRLPRRPGADLGRRPQPGRRAPAAGARHQHPGPRRALRHPQRRARAHRLGRGDRHRAARRLLAHRPRRRGDDARGHRPRPTSSAACPPSACSARSGSRAGGSPPSTRGARRATGAVAGALGIAIGALAVRGAAGDLLEALNEQPPGCGARWRRWPARCWRSSAVVAAAAAWPAWRATARPTVALLRGGRGRRAPGACASAAASPRSAPGSPWRAADGGGERRGAGGAAARSSCSCSVSPRSSRRCATTPARWASATTSPRNLPADRAREVRALPGVADAAPRYIVQGADSFALGEPVKLVAFPGDHTRFEDPPLDARAARCAAATRPRSASGWPRRSGIGVGSTLAVQLPSGGEARFRVVGTVRALDDNGRVAYVRPARVLAADPGATPQVVVKLARGADRAAVTAPAGDARRAAGRRRRRHDAQRRLPRHARRAAARGGDRRRARLPVRAGAGPRARGPRARGPRSRCCAPPAPRAPPWAPSWPARRSPSRCPPRSSRSRSSGSCSPRWSAHLAAGYADVCPRSSAGPGRARRSAGWRCWASWPPRGSRAGPRAAPPLAGLREE